METTIEAIWIVFLIEVDRVDRRLIEVKKLERNLKTWFWFDSTLKPKSGVWTWVDRLVKTWFWFDSTLKPKSWVWAWVERSFFFSTWFNFERGYSSVLDRRLHYLGLWSLHNKFDERSVIIKLHQTTQLFLWALT